MTQLVALLVAIQSGSRLFEEVMPLSAGGDGQVSRQLVTDGKPTLEVRVRSRNEQAYAVQAQTTGTVMPIAKGDVVFIRFQARALASAHESGDGLWGMYFQRNGPPWTTYLGTSATVGRAWRQFYYHFVADGDLANGDAMLTFHIGQLPQTLQFRNVVVENLGKTDPAKLPFTKVDYPGRAEDASWRKEAERRIERYRKGDMVVSVVDAKGRPVRGAKVAVRMRRHAYEFGSFVEQPLLWKNADGDRYRNWFLRAYNKATTPMYWADWGWESTEEMERYMRYPEWFRSHGIPIKAHVLIYPGWRFLPTRMRQFEKEPQAFWKEMERHIREKMEITKKWDFVSWDIINETRDLHDLPTVFGSDRIYADIFKLAHRIDPKPTFYINEYSIIEGGGATEPQQEQYLGMIRYLREQGAPLEGIGIQGHFGETLTHPATVWRIVDRFAKFGLPIQITEFDINTRDEAAQADYTRDLLTAWFAHPATTGFTMWGFWEGSMWQPLGAMVRRDWSIKPNGKVWLDLTRRQWWTNADVVTDRQGKARVRGFRGDYTVTVGGTTANAKMPGTGASVVVRLTNRR